MDNNKLRKYQEVWERIKVREVCTLEVEPFMVARVKKAIIKEKGRDIGFKMLNSHDFFSLSFNYDAEKKYLKIFLKQTGKKLGMPGVVRL